MLFVNESQTETQSDKSRNGGMCIKNIHKKKTPTDSRDMHMYVYYERNTNI